MALFKIRSGGQLHDDTHNPISIMVDGSLTSLDAGEEDLYIGGDMTTPAWFSRPLPITMPSAILNAAQTQATISWTNTSRKATGIRIERRRGLLGSWNLVTTRPASDTSYIDQTTFLTNIQYFWRVTPIRTLDGVTKVAEPAVTNSVTSRSELTCIVPNIEVYTGLAFSGVVSATGGSGGYSFSGGNIFSPRGSYSVASNGLLSGTAPPNTGDADLSLSLRATARDSDGNTDLGFGTLTVRRQIAIVAAAINVNRPISGTTIATRTVRASGGFGGYIYQVTDPASSAVNVTISTTGVISAVIGSTASTGTYTITVTVTDRQGNSQSANVDIIVAVTNLPPVAVGTPGLSVTVGTTLTLNMANFFSDPDGDSLTYSLDTNASFVTINTSTGLLTASPDADEATGDFPVSVFATDPDGLIGTQSFNVTVTAIENKEPVATGTPVLTVQQGSTGTLDMTSFFSDPEGGVLTYSVQQDTPWITISTAGLLTVVVPPEQMVASLTTSVTATDALGLSTSISVSIRIIASGNRSPIALLSNLGITITPGTTRSINMADFFTDPDNDTLRYIHLNRGNPPDPNISLGESSGVFRIRVPSGQTFNSNAVIRATDRFAAAAFINVHIKRTRNVAPIAADEFLLLGAVARGVTNRFNISTHFTDEDPNNPGFIDTILYSLTATTVSFFNLHRITASLDRFSGILSIRIPHGSELAGIGFDMTATDLGGLETTIITQIGPIT